MLALRAFSGLAGQEQELVDQAHQVTSGDRLRIFLLLEIGHITMNRRPDRGQQFAVDRGDRTQSFSDEMIDCPIVDLGPVVCALAFPLALVLLGIDRRPALDPVLLGEGSDADLGRDVFAFEYVVVVNGLAHSNSCQTSNGVTRTR